MNDTIKGVLLLLVGFVTVSSAITSKQEPVVQASTQTLTGKLILTDPMDEEAKVVTSFDVKQLSVEQSTTLKRLRLEATQAAEKLRVYEEQTKRSFGQDVSPCYGDPNSGISYCHAVYKCGSTNVELKGDWALISTTRWGACANNK